MIEHSELSWRYWFATACLLTAVINGYQIAFFLAIWLTLIQLMHFIIRENTITAYSVQLRFWYLLLLLLALLEPLHILAWSVFAATWIQLIFGYSMMERCVSLLPWNRKGKLTKKFILKTFIPHSLQSKIMQEPPPLIQPQKGREIHIDIQHQK